MAKGSIRKRGESWEIAYDLPREPGEKRKQKFVTVKGSRKDAERKLREILTKIDNNTYVDSGKKTLAEYLHQWLRDYCQPNLKQTTVDGYTIIIEKHIIPVLGHHQLSKLTPIHIQEYYSKALKHGRADGTGGLSPRTVLHHHRLLHRAFETALKWQLLSRNICDSVEPPRAKQYEGDIYNERQIEELLATLKDTTLYIPIVIAIATGMRRGEVFALRWKDFNHKKNTITINQTLQATTEGLIFVQPKTKQSRRTVTLPKYVVDELIKHKKKQKREKKRLGDFYTDNDLICCREDGKPWHPGTFSNYFNDHLKKFGLPHLRFHDLRHTHASLLLKQGVNPKVISERLGHSKIGITLDIYSHVMPGMQEEVARQLDEKLFSTQQNDKNVLPTKLPT